MTIETCEIEGLDVIVPDVFNDNRGYFFESFNKQKYYKAGLYDKWMFNQTGLVVGMNPALNFVQDNESFSQRGTIRGLHFQKEPFEQAKLVRVISGKVWDVAVDLRRNSPTFGKWHGVELTGENKKQFFIPCGFAHGFVALEDSIFSYKCTNYYDKNSESGIIWNDKTLKIKWPLENLELHFSEKDMKHQTFEQFYSQMN